MLNKKLKTDDKIKYLENISGSSITPIVDYQTKEISFSVKPSLSMTEPQLEGFCCLIDFFKQNGYQCRQIKNSEIIQEYFFTK